MAHGPTGPWALASSAEIWQPDGAVEAFVAGFDIGGFSECALLSVGSVGCEEAFWRFQNLQRMVSWIVQEAM